MGTFNTARSNQVSMTLEEVIFMEVILDKSIVPPSGDLGRIPNFENIKSIKPNAAIDFKNIP